MLICYKNVITLNATVYGSLATSPSVFTIAPSNALAQRSFEADYKRTEIILVHERTINSASRHPARFTFPTQPNPLSSSPPPTTIPPPPQLIIIALPIISVSAHD
ncbi:unnamed protein product [Mesocestoides corti]|uniref:Uncharacterized protein n=1 Tax=Mesocestoides corti TaxID=53468 RepID=A0A0R3UE90_MESCO|nr:unnamed protein product [Mesocestoides corti]